MDVIMDKITKENVSEAITKICEEAGITKKQLAEFLGVSPSNITRIQKDGEVAGDDFLNRMKALQVLGYAKYKKLISSEKEIDPKYLSGKELTYSGILTGLTAIVSMKSLVGITAISIPLLGLGPAVAGGMLAGGIYMGITKICKKNKLRLSEKNGNLKIEPIKKGETI